MISTDAQKCPTFEAYSGSFDDFVQHCQENFLHYKQAVLNYKSAQEMKEETIPPKLETIEKVSLFKRLFYSCFKKDSDEDSEKDNQFKM